MPTQQVRLSRGDAHFKAKGQLKIKLGLLKKVKLHNYSITFQRKKKRKNGV